MPTPEGRERSALRLLDFIFLLRPTLIVPMWVFFFAGTVLASRDAGVFRTWLLPPTGSALLGLTAMTAVLGGGHILNQIRDIETDRQNDKLFFLPREIISVRAAWVELAVLWVLGGALALGLSPSFRIVLLAALFLNVTYSAGPLPAKSRFPLDMVWNALGLGFVSVAAGWSSVSPLSSTLVPAGAAYALAVAGIMASTTIPDIDGDRRAGMRTAGTVLGPSPTSALAVALVFVATVIGAVIRDPLGFFGPLLSLPLLIRAHATGRRRDRVAADQVAVAAFALVIALQLLYVVVPFLAVYFGSRAYYRARFDISYPGAGTP